MEAHIRDLDEITACIATGGGMDYVMKVFAPVCLPEPDEGFALG